MNKNKIELKPCPFCGGQASFDCDDHGWNWIQCDVCNASSTCAVHCSESCLPLLAEKWNKRINEEG